MQDFQTNNELGSSVAKEYETAARKSGRPFLPIYLVCDVDENLRRVESLDRVTSGMKKLVSCDILKNLLSESELFRFRGYEGLTLDVTKLPPTAAASRILTYIDSEFQKGMTPMINTYSGDCRA
jgi:hypothetical protein